MKAAMNNEDFSLLFHSECLRICEYLNVEDLPDVLFRSTLAGVLGEE